MADSVHMRPHREAASQPGVRPVLAVVPDGALDGTGPRYVRPRGDHRDPRSCRATVRSASRAPSLSPFKAPKFAFDSGLCSKLPSSNARSWRALASAVCSEMSGRVGAFTGSCSCAPTRFCSGRGLRGRGGAPVPVSPGRPRSCCTPGRGGRCAWPGWDDIGERSGRSDVPESTGRAPRVAGRSSVASEADSDISACCEGSGGRDDRSGRAS